jgi:hypothetical protein
MKDKFGVEIKVGDVVLKPSMWGRSPFIDERIVREIRDGKLYLDDSKVAIRYPERLVVFNKE